MWGGRLEVTVASDGTLASLVNLAFVRQHCSTESHHSQSLHVIRLDERDVSCSIGLLRNGLCFESAPGTGHTDTFCGWHLAGYHCLYKPAADMVGVRASR